MLGEVGARLAATAARAASSPPGPDQAKQAAKDILRSDEFRTSKSLLDRFIDWLSDHFQLKFGSGTGPAAVISELLFVSMLIVAVYLLVRLVAGWERRRRPAKAEADGAVIEVDQRRTADAWAQEAERCSAEQRYREALRARYRELVERLIDDGTIVDAVGRTAGELRIEVRAARPAAAAAFSEATDRFEAAWYGQAEPSAADVAHELELARAVLSSERELVGAR